MVRGLVAFLSTLAIVAPSLAAPPQRVVSLGPSLTAIFLELGASDLLVGADERSLRMLPEVRGLPVVGGLFNPSLESIVSLGPDLVALVPGAEQRNLQERLGALGIDVVALPNTSFEELLRSIEVLGGRVGRGKQARARVEEIREAFRRAEVDGLGAEALRGVWVLQRDPLFVVGAGSFLDRMLAVAGVVNLAAEFDSPYPRVSVEWLIDAAPQLILDASEGGGPALDYWSRWPSLPAVTSGGVVDVEAAQLTLPGPRVDAALARLLSLLAPRRGTAPDAESSR